MLISTFISTLLDAVTAGSLGQALSQAAGIAFARARKGHTGRVVVFMSDGELQKGRLGRPCNH